MILLFVAVGALAQCGLSDPLAIRRNNTNVVAGFNLKQRIAFRIGQVECLKTLLSEGEYRNAQFGLGALHRGNYSRDISRFDFKQRIAFLLGQVQCLRIHATLGVKNDSRQVPQVEGTECNPLQNTLHLNTVACALPYKPYESYCEHCAH